MKPVLFFIWIFFAGIRVLLNAQEIPEEEQLEQLAGSSEILPEDDSQWQALAWLKSQPIHINTADREDLQSLYWLTDRQIDQLLVYRRLFGDLVSRYELQAVPGWDIPTIRKTIPFITTAADHVGLAVWKERFRLGQYSWLARCSVSLGQEERYQDPSGYAGDRSHRMFRFQYRYKNLMQYGITGEKDAGESFFRGAQRAGFDFYSVHFFARKWGVVEALALGDYTVNLGQGLIQWQSLAFGKTAEVTNVRRQSPVLRPYNSTGESYFFRGAGVTLRKKNFQLTGFASRRMLSARVVADPASGERFVTSFDYSGYHRTGSEIRMKGAVTQYSTGASLSYQAARGHIAINVIDHSYSQPVRRRPQPYNRFAWSGWNWYNASFDYSYTIQNLHVFGETAMDKRKQLATLHGMLISVDPRFDLSFLFRHIGMAYQAVYGDAFTENSNPTNETGFYAGMRLRPAAGWQIDLYADIFNFPWLRFGVSRPGQGREFLVRAIFKPSRRLECYLVFRDESKEKDDEQPAGRIESPVPVRKWNGRLQVSYKLSADFSWKYRTEMVWRKKYGEDLETGFLAFTDFTYHAIGKPYSLNVRMQYFDTEGYDTRLYAYENSVLYTWSVPAFSGEGFRYYVNASVSLKKRIKIWIRWSQLIHKEIDMSNQNQELSGLSPKSEMVLQLRIER